MNKHIVINGASRGIGAELVKVFAQDLNCNVLALGRNIEKMREIFGGFPNVSCFEFDLEKPISPQVEVWATALPSVDILINSAGYLVKKPFEQLSKEDLTKSIQVNYLGPIELIQSLLPALSKTDSHVVNISSMGAFQGSVKFPELSAYGSSKAALTVFTELFAEEFKGQNIRMNCLCLGAVQTEMLEEAFPGYQAPHTALQMANYIKEFALKSGLFYNGKILPVSTSTP